MNRKEWDGGIYPKENWRDINSMCYHTWQIGTIYMDYTYHDCGWKVILIKKDCGQPLVLDYEELLKGNWHTSWAGYSDKMVPLGYVDLPEALCSQLKEKGEISEENIAAAGSYLEENFTPSIMMFHNIAEYIASKHMSKKEAREALDLLLSGEGLTDEELETMAVKLCDSRTA